MAQSNKKEFPIPFRIDDKHDDYLFNIKEFGSKGYEWILTNQEYSLVIGKWFKPQAMPSVILTIRSETLWRFNLLSIFLQPPAEKFKRHGSADLIYVWIHCSPFRYGLQIS
jgi:hypothetical protein